MSPATRQRWIWIGFVASFLFFAEFPAFRISTATHTIGQEMTDHCSHWGSAVLMMASGLDVYRTPADELCERPAVVEDPRTLCQPKQGPGLRPVLVNWGQYPRVYPPGAMLLGALPAGLYVAKILNFSQANLLMLLLILVGAYVATYALVLCFRSGLSSALPQSEDSKAAVAFFLLLVVPFAHLELVAGALRGIYDPVAIAAVVFGILFLRQERPVAALLALSAGLFVHFRALWYLPLVLLAMKQVYDTRAQWRASRARQAAVLGSGVLLGLACFSFLLVMPALYRFPVKNTFLVSEMVKAPHRFVTFGLPIVLCLAVLVSQRLWTTAVLAAWLLFMLSQTREVRNWHGLFALPLLALAGTERRAPMTAVATVLVLYFWLSVDVFQSWPLSSTFLKDLLEA